MVFERKIRVKGRTYWILEHTLRKGKKYTKKSKYIGKSLPSRQKLDKLKKDFLREMQRPGCKYLSGEDIKNIEEKKAEYRNESRKLSQLEKEKRLKEFIIRFTYDSTKLSGVRITLRQTSLILKEGIIPKNIKSLRTVKELENHEKGILAITNYRGSLNLKFIKMLHKILFAGIDDTIAGKLRSELKRDVKVAGTSYVPPKWHEIRKEMDNFIKWHKAEKKTLHPLELASLVHAKLISMQPFVDGNSRLSRLLMNWILWKRNYPLVDIPIEDLEKYYDVLDKYQIERDEMPFIGYIKRKYLGTN